MPESSPLSEPIIEALRALNDWLREREIPHAVIGGVPRPTDLVVMKAVAMRPKDVLDIVRILDLHRDLDFDRIRRWVGEFAAVLEMPELLENLETLLKQQRPG